MEKGSLRCDANVSVRPVGQEKFGTKVEIKNLNSFKMVQKAIQYEIDRQIETIEDGGTIVQETRLWNDAKGTTFSMRSKEEAHDYRYFPEPDLVPFTLSRTVVEDIRKTLPELPLERAKRLVKKFGIFEYDAFVIVQEKKSADFYEEINEEYDKLLKNKISQIVNPKYISNWLQTEYFGQLNQRNLSLDQSRVSPKDFAGLMWLIEDHTVSAKMAKEDILPFMIETGKTAEAIVKEKGLTQVSDTGLIEKAVEKAIAANPGAVAEFKAGKQKALGALVGAVMKETQGKANPKIVNELLMKKLVGG
jgi:aspartyl-tRNA(Asn)/glutamyl-tRNA(Gln) amidotransferase subunit B